MRAFVTMRHYVGNVEAKIIEHDEKIRLLQESFDKLQENKVKSDIYYSGQIYDAYSVILDIFNECKTELIIIDSYADKKILDIIRKLKIEVIIITKKDNLLSKEDIVKYNKQYHNLKVIYNNTFHDRYFILDKSIVYHCGTSINRIGYKTFSINLMNDDKLKEHFLLEINKIIKEN